MIPKKIHLTGTRQQVPVYTPVPFKRPGNKGYRQLSLHTAPRASRLGIYSNAYSFFFLTWLYLLFV